MNSPKELVASNAGFSLLEGLVGAVVGGLVIYGISAGMVQSLRVAKGVEMKTEVNNFHQLVSLGLASSGACTKLLPSGFSVPSDKLPEKGSESCATCISEVSQIRLGGTTYLADQRTRIGSGLEFVGAKLRLDRHRTKLSEKVDEYEATLQYTLAGKASGGLATYNKEFPLLVELERESPTASSATLSSCFGIGATNSGTELCDKMGGVWLKNAEDEKYFPRERCHFGGQIELDSQEWPDLLDSEGYVKNSVRPMECRYRVGSTVSAYKCPGRAEGSTRKGWTCHYVKGAPGKWWYSYVSGFTTTGGVTKPIYSSGAAYNKECTAGVTAARNNSFSEQLKFHEPLVKAFSPQADSFTGSGGTTAEYLAESDRLPTVQSCQKQWDVDTWTPCANPLNPDLARSGGVGACIFVRNGVVDGISKLGPEVTAFSTANNARNYTGWMQVTSARAFGMLDSSGNKLPTLTEAIGTPCYQVEVNVAGYSAGEFESPVFTAAGATPDGGFQRVAQCIVALPATRGAPAGATVRYTTLSCSKNGSLGGDPLSWTEIESDESRLPDALSSLQIETTSSPAGVLSFGKLVRSNSTATAAPGAPANALTDTTQLDSADIVHVVFEDLNGDGEPEDCLYKRSAQKWGSSVSDGQKRQITGSLDQAANAGAAFLYDGRTYERTTDSGTKMANLACTTAGALDVVPANELVALRNKINAQIALESKAASDYLAADTCAYFQNAKVTNRANAVIGTVKDASATYTVLNDGASIKATLATSVKHPPVTLASAATSIGQTALESAFNGWVWLRAGITKARFRTVDDGDRQVTWNDPLKSFSASPLTTSKPVLFSQVELYHLSGSWVPFPPLGKIANRQYFVPMGTYSTPSATRRPTIAINGELCTQGVRFRAAPQGVQSQ